MITKNIQSVSAEEGLYGDAQDLSTYDYVLPPELIATEPTEVRDHARLMHVDRKTGIISHRVFADLLCEIPTDAVLVLNHSKVIPARLATKKTSGGRAEFLFLSRDVDMDLCEAHVLSTAKGLTRGTILNTARGASLEIVERLEEGYRIRLCEGAGDIPSLLMAEGEMPIPPYIMKARERLARPAVDLRDREAYQTVYAAQADAMGSVAAPTAGLHFTPELLTGLKSRGVSVESLALHVGWGTFQPIRSKSLDAHRMHQETFDIPSDVATRIMRAKNAGRPVIAVGSTVVRALESAFDPKNRVLNSGLQHTEIFIRPGYTFNIVDQMITNFHVPQSSLLVMVSAFASLSLIREAYSVAIEARYRFFSYGDAMWIV